MANVGMLRTYYLRYHQALWDFKILPGGLEITHESEDAFHWHTFGFFIRSLGCVGPYPLTQKCCGYIWKMMLGFFPEGRCWREHMLVIDWGLEDDVSLPDASSDIADMGEDE